MKLCIIYLFIYLEKLKTEMFSSYLIYKLHLELKLIFRFQIRNKSRLHSLSIFRFLYLCMISKLSAKAKEYRSSAWIFHFLIEYVYHCINCGDGYLFPYTMTMIIHFKNQMAVFF